MQSRVYQELHQRRQAAARITGADADRTAFVTGLLEDTLLIHDARTSFLANVRRAGITGALFELAAEEATATVLRAAFRRTTDLLNWQADLAPSPGGGAIRPCTSTTTARAAATNAASATTAPAAPS
ncbi:hypothetical protein [Deinococcus aquaticus]|uniref:hypothetical protein n=1 Tax=Deinococcus aquaticus TaxID=328692 RepID=UPI00361C1690